MVEQQQLPGLLVCPLRHFTVFVFAEHCLQNVIAVASSYDEQVLWLVICIKIWLPSLLLGDFRRKCAQVLLLLLLWWSIFCQLNINNCCFNLRCGTGSEESSSSTGDDHTQGSLGPFVCFPQSCVPFYWDCTGQQYRYLLFNWFKQQQEVVLADSFPLNSALFAVVNNVLLIC